MQSDQDGRFEFVVDDPGRYLLLAGGGLRPFAWSSVLELESGGVQGPLIRTIDDGGRISGTFTPISPQRDG